MMGKKSSLFLCRCKAEVVSSDTMDAVSESLKKLDADVIEVHDLCAASLSNRNDLNAAGQAYHQNIIIACYPRAVKNMLIQNQIKLEDPQFLNFKELTNESIQVKLKNDFQIKDGEARYHFIVSGLDVPAWYPVIDQSLCTLCGKCARFCLFGVYNYNKSSLKVVDPLACKNNCPACGRTCPASAIIFPRLSEKSVLAGEEPGGNKISIDKGNLLSALHERNRTRRNIFRPGVMEQAEEERRKALMEFKTKPVNIIKNDQTDSQQNG